MAPLFVRRLEALSVEPRAGKSPDLLLEHFCFRRHPGLHLLQIGHVDAHVDLLAQFLGRDRQPVLFTFFQLLLRRGSFYQLDGG